MSEDIIDFEGMTDDEIIALIVERMDEFGDYDVSLEFIEERRDRLTIERFPHGVALLLNAGKYNQELWFLYVDPQYRGRRLGRQYVRYITKKYDEFFLSLHCHKSLRPFYSACGFRVVERYGDNRKMQG